MSLFSILVDIAARTASFESGIQRVERGLGQLNATATRFSQNTKNLLGVALGFEAVRRSIGAAVQRGDELDRLSNRMKTSVEFLSQLQYVAGEADVPFNVLSDSIDTLRKNVSLAADGMGKARPALKALGLDARELAALPLDKQLEVVADRIAAIENPTLQTRLAIQLMGDAATAMLPVLKRGSDGIRELRAESDRLGQTLSTAAARRLAEADEAMKHMKASATGLTNYLSVALAPAIISVADSLRKLAGGAVELEKLEAKLAFLEEQGGSFIPFILQFGYIDGGGIVMGPEAIAKAAEQIRQSIAKIKSEASGKSGDALTEVVVTAERRQETHVKRFINPQTMHEFDRNVAYIEELEQKLVAETRRNMQLFQDELEDGIQHGIAATNEWIEARLELLRESTESTTSEISAFAEEAARNMQDYFANFLFDPFDEGLDGMLKGFIDTLRRMLAEAAAAKVFETLFGKTGSSGGGGALAGFLGSLFGGFKAEGGPLQSGKWYIAGEHGPEPIWGGGAGAYAAGYGRGGGSMVFAPTYHIDARGATPDVVRAFPEILRRNNDQLEAKIVRRLRRNYYGTGRG